MSEDLNKRHKAALDVALMDLDVAAIPTKSDVFVRCGTGARDLHDAITDLRQRLQAAEERAEKVAGAIKTVRQALIDHGSGTCGPHCEAMYEDAVFFKEEIALIDAALKTEA